MKLIAIDSSGLVASAAVLEDDHLLACYTIDHKKTHSQTLLPMLDEIAGMIELDLSTVDAIAVAAGPGSFTGLRIGSATAKGLGFATDKPIIEVPTLAAMAYNLYNARGLICPIMDARRDQVYNGLYCYWDYNLLTVCDQRAIGIEELAAEINHRRHSRGTIFIGDGVPVYREKLDSLLTVPHCYAPAHVNRQNAAAVGAYAMVLYREGKFVKSDDHAPIYLRKSQAEREREKLLRDGGDKAQAKDSAAEAKTEHENEKLPRDSGDKAQAKDSAAEAKAERE